ncbi:DNA-binding protein [Aphanothece hegewaldii CCALA 016]|uniref:DNA-binding protein n=1 Tax=Aphanothece hegewaldii CCALA 016 TaxID=2107694 RepID=A0A2T1LRW6_9CHRO|nr:type II toxin-antitoxin system VapC family toxin [Aphanothece hegewaldii]PSF31393.1 DNA-binding protein [Aphanothece hegewaldii CCALA 016]
MIPFVIIDSNVVAKWFFPEVLTEKALALRKDWQVGAIELIAPELLLLEVSHVISQKKRTHFITPDESRTTLQNLLFLDIPTVAIYPLLATAHEMTIVFELTLDDALYLALAQELGGKFITADPWLYHSLRLKIDFIEFLENYKSMAQ